MLAKDFNSKIMKNDNPLYEENKPLVPLNQKRKEIIFQSITENESASKIDNGNSRYYKSDKTVNSIPKQTLKEFEVYQSSER